MFNLDNKSLMKLLITSLPSFSVQDLHKLDMLVWSELQERDGGAEVQEVRVTV